MSDDNIVFIGLDTHKESTEIATVLDVREQKPVHVGKIKTNRQAFEKLARQLQSKYPHATLHCVYEAGPCGYWVYRLLTRLGHCCYIVAPSLIPKKPGKRVKTDKRDALMLAQLLKNGDMEPIYVPEPDDEAVRDLSRARESAMRDLNDAKYQLKALLLRNNIRYAGTANWTLKHLRWLTEIILPHPCQQIVRQEMIRTVTERTRRLERLDNELSHHVRGWRYYPVVKAIPAMRGVRLLVAVGVIAELGDLSRFDHPRKLMSYVGLTPSEHSSSDKRDAWVPSPNVAMGEPGGYWSKVRTVTVMAQRYRRNCRSAKRAYRKRPLISPGGHSCDFVAGTSAWWRVASIAT